MNHQTHTEEQHIAQDVPAQPQTPSDYLALFPGSPSPAQVESYRQQVPGGRLRLLPMPDGKRLFLLRAFTALELAGVQAELQRIPEDKQANHLQVQMSIRCCLWTSVVKTGKLTENDLASSGAGLASSLYFAITDLSDFTAPAVLEQLFVDF